MKKKYINFFLTISDFKCWSWWKRQVYKCPHIKLSKLKLQVPLVSRPKMSFSLNRWKTDILWTRCVALFCRLRELPISIKFTHWWLRRVHEQNIWKQEFQNSHSNSIFIMSCRFWEFKSVAKWFLPPRMHRWFREIKDEN